MNVILSPLKLRQQAESWLMEDQPSFDFGALATKGEEPMEAYLYCKQSCVLAGGPFFDAVFDVLGCTVSWSANDGDNIRIVEGKKIIATVYGSCRNILLGERPALNCLSRCSGVATLTRKVVQHCRSSMTPPWAGKVACTRKTTPGFRLVEKYGVLVGGGDPHRYDLSSMVMLKDNHIAACGGDIDKAVEKVRQISGFSYKIEIESRNGDEAMKAAQSGADVIMLDNFGPQNAKNTANSLKKQFPHKIIEVSGGIKEDNISLYCSPDVDIISLGILTQGYPCIDFSLKFEKTA